MPFHSVSLGSFELIAIQAMADRVIQASDLFPEVQPEEFEAEFQRNPFYFGETATDLRFTQNLCVVRNGAQTVLVDTGIPVEQDGAMLLHGLAEAGINPEEVTHVILTHRDLDHVGGNLRDGKPVYPNAQYLMGKTEADSYRVDPERAHFGNYIGPIEALGKFDMVADDAEVIPGIRLYFTPGHRPGATSVIVDDLALLLADVWHCPMQTAHPEWKIKYDSDPVLAVETRSKTVQFAEEENLIVAVPHTPEFGIGRIVGSRWKPMV